MLCGAGGKKTVKCELGMDQQIKDDAPLVGASSDIYQPVLA